ncbi:histidine decarboxylase-like [Symsagittifera roscoffensis]|uniref:histidine decarboxylase-like n=1 Tax=Symsagittifera roscoffensis TaxID=84072 RepID=UPI00307C7DE2
MDADEYRKHGKAMVDKIADYMSNVRDYDVLPKDVYPGYLKDQLPKQAPKEGEPFEKIAEDIDKVILPGTTHWQSPHMHAFFPALNSYASLLGDMMADAINCIGFTWEASPVCTELEIVVMNWLCDALGLPDKFQHNRPHSFGGGVIYTTCSEATLSAMMASRKRAIDERKSRHVCGRRGLADADILSRLVAYCSDQAHSSVEKASMLCMVTLRHLPTDKDTKALRGHTLKQAIEEDTAKGLIPFFVCATLGTTGICAFDNVDEIGQVAGEFGLWVHVDAAYAGTAFICPEFRYLLKGAETVDSFAFNPSKWMMVHFDCTAFWVADYRCLENAFCINPVYLMHDNMDKSVDFMHWQVPLSRRFRALKLWFVLRSFGIEGLQKHVRQGVELAAYFEQLMASNKIFEVKAKRILGLVVFQLKNNSGLTKKLLSELLASRKLYAVPALLDGETVIRFTVTSANTTREDIEHDWKLIEETGLKVIAEDYEKCFAGECLTCSKERAAAASAASRVNQQAGGCVPMAPAIEITDEPSLDDSDVGDERKLSDGSGKRSEDSMISSELSEIMCSAGHNKNGNGKLFTPVQGAKGIIVSFRGPSMSSRPIPEMSEEGSHLEGKIGGNCHDSDDEVCSSELHGDENSGSEWESEANAPVKGKEEVSDGSSYVDSDLEIKRIEHCFTGFKQGETKKDLLRAKSYDLDSVSLSVGDEDKSYERSSVWMRTGSFVSRMGKRMANLGSPR